MTSTKVSFGITRKLEPKFKTPLISSEDKPASSNIEFISGVSDLEFVSRDPSKSLSRTQGELVIPLIKRNKYSAIKISASAPVLSSSASSEDQAAAAAILNDVNNLSSGLSGDSGGKMEIAEIPMWMQNRLPAGYETDEKLNVELRANESTLEDYEKIPVDQFGLAMLRGMGWKETEGIGLKNKSVTKPLEVVARPRGLGLGATPAKDRLKDKNSSDQKDEKEIPLAVGSYVSITSGRYLNRVEKIASQDEEAGRFIVALVGEKNLNVSIPGSALKTISEKEYRRAEKYINNDSYYEYAIVDEVQHMSLKSSRKDGKRDERNGRDDSRKRRKEESRRRRSRSRSSSRERRRKS